MPRFEPICRFVAFLVVFVHGSIALGPPPPLFAFPSLNFADFPRIRGIFGAHVRPKSSQLAQIRAQRYCRRSGTTGRTSGTTARVRFFSKFFFSSVRFGISSCLLSPSLVCTTRLRHRQASAATSSTPSDDATKDSTFPPPSFPL